MSVQDSSQKKKKKRSVQYSLLKATSKKHRVIKKFSHTLDKNELICSFFVFCDLR